jgi:hypothetical protein
MCKKTNSIVGKIIGHDHSKNNVKQTVGLGVASMAGMGVMGAMPQTPGSGNITSSVGSGLAMLNTGQMMKNAKDVTGMIGGGKKHGKYHK